MKSHCCNIQERTVEGPPLSTVRRAPEYGRLAFMSDYRRRLLDKTVSAEEALSHIASGSTIYCGCCAQEPRALLSGISGLSGRVRDLSVRMTMGLCNYDFLQDPSYKNLLTVESAFFMSPARRSQGEGITSFTPVNLHEMGRLTRRRPPDVFLCTVSPMDRHGYFRASLSLIHEKELFEQARMVIVEVNPHFPLVGGETEVHIDAVDYVVESDLPLLCLPRSIPGPAEETIGEYVSGLVKDGDTIQLGVGNIPDAVSASFINKHDLGVHTEMLTSGIVDLVEAGVITNRKKNFHRGKIVATFIYGDQRLYDFVDENPSVELFRSSVVNNPYVVAQNDNMVSINTALAVDLTGQVSSEGIGTLHFSGTGGQCDMATGANHSRGGRSIIALHSTAKGGNLSTISTVLAPGSAVTLSRNCVDYVVTEYGVAELVGCSVRERVLRLISVAHPDFRAELKRDARSYGLI